LQTGIYDRLASVEENYLNALRTGINLSRMHFRDELKKQSSPKPGIPCLRASCASFVTLI